MVIGIPEAARPSQHVFAVGGKRYFLASDEKARELRRERAWSTEWIPDQPVQREVPFVIDLSTFHFGYGLSYAAQGGGYEQANGWDGSSPGQMQTWPELTTGEAFTDVDYRGWVIFHSPYMYVGRGRYVAKYAPNDTVSDQWDILEFHNLGEDVAAAGRMAIFKGALYVPRVDHTDDSLQRFHRITTVSTPVTEVQTVVISGGPTGGTYDLIYDDDVTETTLTLAWDADEAAVEAAIQTIPGCQKATVVTTGVSPNFTHTITLAAAPTFLGSTSPPEFTADAGSLTGGAPVVTPDTTVPGTGDQWDIGPEDTEARAFKVWARKLVRADEAAVHTVIADPQVANDWSAGFPVGESTHDVTDLAVWGPLLVPGKPDGIYTFDEVAHDVPELPDLGGEVDAQQTIGMEYAQARILIPTRAGLVSWAPGSYSKVGAEEDGFYEGDLAQGWGRVMGIAPRGRDIYASINDPRNTKGAVVSYAPGPRAGGYVPHMSHLIDSEVEHCALVQLASGPVLPTSPTAPTDDNAVGSIAWANPGNAQASDDSRATAAAGTSHYLEALLAAGTRVPTGATVDGIKVEIERRANSAIAFRSQDSAFGTGTSLAIPVPAGVVAGDLLLAIYTSASFLSLPAGWAQIETTQNLGGNGETVAAFHVAGGAEPADYTFNASISGDQEGAMVALSGIDDADPINVTSAARNWVTTDAIAPSVTPTAPQTMLVGLFAMNSTHGPWTPPSGMDERVDVDNQRATEIATEPWDPASATGTRTAVATTAGFWAAFLVAVNPKRTVADNIVRLVRGGVVVGDNKATADAWLADDAFATYGGATDLWGTTFTPAQINAADFGMVLSAAVTDGVGAVDSIRITVYFTPLGAGDPSTYLAVLAVDAARTTVTPHIFKLPRAGLQPANDPNIDHAASNVDFLTPRLYPPERNIQKTYRTVEAWAELSPAVNTPGLQVNAIIDDGAAVQLLDAAGNPATIRATGPVRLFLPQTAAGIGHYIQLQPLVPALAGDEVGVSVKLRDIKIRGVFNPISTARGVAVVLVKQGLYDDGTPMLDTNKAQAEALEALVQPAAAPVAYVDPETGAEGFLDVQSIQIREFNFTGSTAPELVAIVTFGILRYS